MCRTRCFHRLARVSALLGFLFLAACDGNDPAAPELEEADSASIVFVSLFNDENGGEGALNWTDFEDWDVVAGCVDLHGNGFIDIWPNNGVYVDLDGTCEEGGTLRSREPLTLAPGDYLLEFWLAGNNRIETPDTVIVTLGTVHEEEIVLETDDPFALFTRELTVTEETSAFLSFQNLGGDDQGALLDLVRVRSP
jgi:hypothetical protein